MKRFLIALLLCSAPMARGANGPAVTFYVQLVRGSDADSRPASQARAIGPKLDHRLHEVFRWRNYWEVKREVLNVKPGAKVRRRITPQREVEITMPDACDMVVSIYADGKLTRKRTQPIDAAFYIAGGDMDVAQPWFIVVRRDNPDADQKLATGLAAMP
jgi:hypothetical protein